MNKSWLESGRLETILALIVLGAVVALFVRFYQPTTRPVPEQPSEIETPAASSTSHP